MAIFKKKFSRQYIMCEFYSIIEMSYGTKKEVKNKDIRNGNQGFPVKFFSYNAREMLLQGDTFTGPRYSS